MKKIIYCLFLVSALFTTSCVEEEKDIFSDSSANRMTADLERIDKILNAAPNGWHMVYYAEKEPLTMGGYNYFCSFDDGMVTLATEIEFTDYAPGETYTSKYKMIGSQGPVLSFDTFNPLLHYFRTPSSGDIDGYSGDYEFVIEEATDSRIIMTGTTARKKIIMERISDDVSWNDYLAKVIDIRAKMDVDINYHVLVNGSQVVDAQVIPATMDEGKSISGNELDILYQSDDEFEDLTETVPFVITPTGIKFYEPVTIGGVTFEELTYDEDSKSLMGDGIVFQNYKPEGYVTFHELAGQITAYQNGRNGRLINIEPIVNHQSFSITGLLDMRIRATYDSRTSKITLSQQAVSVLSNTNYVFMLPVYTTNRIGYNSYATYVGTPIVSGGSLEITFESGNKYNPDQIVQGFILFIIDVEILQSGEGDPFVGQYEGTNTQFVNLSMRKTL